ncbi:YopX family protein [Lactiplantibacillus argentoratensis]|uniref:YopX family protein n=1 Tax=Lactiplantibacillus argentoratensis TaxID=271881 RepID=UPI003D2A3D21
MDKEIPAWAIQAACEAMGYADESEVAWEDRGKEYIKDVLIGSDGKIYFDDGVATQDDLDISVEQFTGLKDVNSNDIYTGDILEVTIDGTVQADKYLVKNVWDPHVWTEESDGYYAVSKMEVQGNVHENPELLEADK